MLRVISYRHTRHVIVVVFEQDGSPQRYSVVALWLASGVALEERDIAGMFIALKLQRALLAQPTPPPATPRASSGATEVIVEVAA